MVVCRVRAPLAVASLLLLAACSSGGSDETTRSNAAAATSAPVATPTTVPEPMTTAPTTTAAQRRALAPDAFDATDALLDDRVHAAGAAGGMVRIVDADGSVLHEHTVGGFSGSTSLAVASSTKWLTAATFMTFVDQGAIALDDDVSRWLPEFAGSSPAITPRQLLSGASGVHDNPCQNGGTALAACVQTLAASPREFPAGTRYSYGNSPFLVVGRLVEVLGQSDFASVVQRRLTGPLGMDATTWPGAPDSANPAFGVQITVDDYGTFLDMLLHDGMLHGTRVLSSKAVSEVVSNQVSAYDTSHDYSVGITGIPRYGLGCWIDVEDHAMRGTVVSGSGGKGLYPWIDFTTRTYGVVGVQDERGAELAVPASQQVEVEARTAVTR